MSCSQARLTFIAQNNATPLCLSRNYCFVPLKIRWQFIHTPKAKIHSNTNLKFFSPGTLLSYVEIFYTEVIYLTKYNFASKTISGFFLFCCPAMVLVQVQTCWNRATDWRSPTNGSNVLIALGDSSSSLDVPLVECNKLLVYSFTSNCSLSASTHGSLWRFNGVHLLRDLPPYVVFGREQFH